MDVLRLTTCATVFRQAIERLDPNELTISFGSFPRGSCGDVTPLLGTYLVEQGFPPFQYMLGDYGSRAADTWSSHAWLQRGTLVVDITADQFPEIRTPVLVIDGSEWHARLRGKAQNLGDYRIYGPPAASELAQAYRAIVAEIKRYDSASPARGT